MFSSDAAAGTKGAHFVTDIVSARRCPGPEREERTVDEELGGRIGNGRSQLLGRGHGKEAVGLIGYRHGHLVRAPPDDVSGGGPVVVILERPRRVAEGGGSGSGFAAGPPGRSGHSPPPGAPPSAATPRAGPTRPKPSSPSTRPRTSTRPMPSPVRTSTSTNRRPTPGRSEGLPPRPPHPGHPGCPLGRAHPPPIRASSWLVPSWRHDAPRHPTSDSTRPQDDHPSNALLAAEKPVSYDGFKRGGAFERAISGDPATGAVASAARTRADAGRDAGRDERRSPDATITGGPCAVPRTRVPPDPKRRHP
jgi:hypothetical protein